MLDQFKGCLLGAAIGDALGMARESTPPDFQRLHEGYRRAWRGHPNAGLKPGQFTDDTQMMLLVAEMLADGTYSESAYAAALARMYANEELRFPDGAVDAACRHLLLSSGKPGGVSSNTAGCTGIAVPFGLLYGDPIDVTERVVQACSVTHTHPAAHAGAVTVAMLVHHAVRGRPDALSVAGKHAVLEDVALGNKIRDAVNLAKEGISLESALSVIGNDVTVYQTVPLAFFLINRIKDVTALLTTAAHVGGNTDTIALICGAYAGATYGKSALPPDLLDGLEGRDEIESIAARLYERYTAKP
ncbi:ADP-ribosylglycohydrolase family protein [Methanoculleus sp. YWC-01]|uniref:ADP-ribosylglycohydrolase family protein n=1 Tax=Methanoculleus nereidis TaxID=2735141 RepID=A0ABU3YZF4_9EURY|nr:ADP-ribosylglycohydrolase family protein [Methanoculleus sp. YWC-01]MDV4341938.1 ADP-ribosylglycohydrolase family protein [Methanoculleus sp. YWC-01]